jgi:hypothetical protein
LGGLLLIGFQGPAFHLPAAMCFYRALRVYPSPVELIVIYEKTVPPPVFQVRFYWYPDDHYMLLTLTTAACDGIDKSGRE